MTNCIYSAPQNASATAPGEGEAWQFSQSQCSNSTSTDPTITYGDLNIFLILFLLFLAVLFFGLMGLIRSVKIKKKT